MTFSAMKLTFTVPVPDTVAGIVSQHNLFSAVKMYLPSKSPAFDSIAVALSRVYGSPTPAPEGGCGHCGPTVFSLMQYKWVTE